MTRLMSKELPKWLQPGRDVSHTSESNRAHYVRSIRYHFKIWQATSKWLTDEQRSQVRAIYKECKRQRALGLKVAVDHVVPVCSDIVCGLQVPWNLQIVTEAENYAKSNTWWPECPHDNREMFEKELQPHQLGLGI